jgi:hypothetical protein
MRREVTGKVWIVRMSPSVGGLEAGSEKREALKKT